jgi:ATP-dependent RNA helicase RhlE
LVFTRTKQGANKLTESMIGAGIKAAAIHGNKGQGARTNALAGFKNGSLTALVATDIAARGLDIPLLPHVVNFELPNIPEDYVHRIGRTGRAGASGEAISLFSPDETVFLRDIEKLVGLKLPKENIAGFEPDPNASTEPIKQGQGRQQRFSNPAKSNSANSNRSANNSFGPRRPQQNNDRRSNR